MKILILGEIIGRPGREAAKKVLPDLSKKYKPDLIIANGEHLAGGKGLTLEKVDEMRKIGIDVFTTGNHVWDKRDFFEYLDDQDIPVIRPLNYPDYEVPGRGFQTIEIGKEKVAIINLMGCVFTNYCLESPFRIIDQFLNENKFDITILDFHAEASSEKIALGQYLDGKINFIFGTHTHIPTSDLQILPQGTGYVTDIGMIGPQKSILGADSERVISHFLNQMPWKYEVASDKNCIFNAIYIEVVKNKILKQEKIEKLILLD